VTNVNALLPKGRDLYVTLSSGDVAALSRLLSEDFEGDLTPGLPYGLGRRYVGRHAMITEAWAVVARDFEMAPYPDELIDGGDVLVARGWYVGTVKRTGKPIRAAFAHFWRFDGERFTAVQQVTDSGIWRDALVE
jgi:2-(1,2-epoxy-1,2-dihydrophenyl)acetyl-CoA isomerase